MVNIVRSKYADAQAVAGVATGAIAIGALVAHALQLPFAYVRPKPKEHGLENQIEGQLAPGCRVVVVEDLISTGGSSLAAVAALRKANVSVMGMVAIFTYAFPQAEANFAREGVALDTLESYPSLLALLASQGRLTEADRLSLASWRQAPETWGR